MRVRIRSAHSNKVHEIQSMESSGKSHEVPSTAEEVLLGLNRIFPIVKRLYGVRKIGIFGTFARRDPDDSGRTELLVEFSKGFETYRFYLDLRQYLCEHLGIEVYLVTSRVYQEGENPAGGKPGDIPVDREPVAALIADFETLAEKCGGLSVEAFSRNSSLRDFAEECLETAALIVRETSPETKKSGPKIPWGEIEAIGADIACSRYPADPHLVWHYIHSDVPVILGNLRRLATN